MADRIYDIEEATDSLEAYLSRHSRRSHGIYAIVVALVLAGVVALPLVRVTVSVGAAGVLRPALDVQEVRAAVGGEAARVLVGRGAAVARGDPLVELDAGPTRARVRVLEERAAEVDKAFADLGLLLAAGTTAALEGLALESSELQRERDRLVDELRENALRVAQARVEAERLGALGERGLVPQQESERARHALAAAVAASDLILARQRAAWEGRRAGADRESAELQAELRRLREDLDRHTIVAPASGTVEEMRVQVAGTYVQPGQVVATISPEEAMVAEVFASPADVGLLRPGMPARLHVDAFNYRDWGYLGGRIAGISSDYVLLQDRPVFRVAVEVEEDALRLPSGVEGELRKGMTLQARFVLAERTLLQLLRDDVADWIHPWRATAG